VNTERAQFIEACRKQSPFHIQRKQIEFLCARKRLETSVLLEPPHHPTFLIDEDHRAGRQRGNLRAQAEQLLGGIDIVVVFSGLAGIVEQDHCITSHAHSRLAPPPPF